MGISLIYDFESILVIYDLNWDYMRLSMECDYIKEFENIGVYDYGLILSYESISIDFRSMISICICSSRMPKGK